MIKRIILILVFSLIGFIIGLTAYLFQTVNRPINPNSKENIVFKVNPHTPTESIASSLKDKSIISSPVAFRLYVAIFRINLKTGQYELSPSMSISEITEILSSGKVKTTKITLIEGWTIEQMGEKLEYKKIISKEDFIEKATGQEGYLFPDTYIFPIGITSQEIINIMKENFHQRTEGLNVTPDVVILASIVEREAKADEDRPLMAGVYANRLKNDMLLQADPTVQYAKGSWASITQDDYKNVISPYNTYLNKGLPPGPICSPGLKSLQAATNPAKHDYLYFYTPKSGSTLYAKTFEEHKANIRKSL